MGYNKADGMTETILAQHNNRCSEYDGAIFLSEYLGT